MKIKHWWKQAEAVGLMGDVPSPVDISRGATYSALADP